MSLITWYPLNSNLNDYSGNNNNLVAYSNFIYDAGGKIGGCYRASQTSSYASSTNNLYLNEDMSMCTWFKLDAYSTSPTAIITNHDHASTSNFGINLAGDKIAISIGYTDGTREWSARNSTTTIALNKWYHVVLTYKKSTKNLKLYVNGVLERNETLTKEVKVTSKPLQINRWSINYSSAYTTTGRYNDIRIYDHELSVKEIKEIAKAKILHYKFDDPYEEPTVNLAPPQNKVILTNINPGWDTSKHVGAIQVENWTTGYNSGVASPSLGYHAHWVMDDNNKPIMKFINKNNTEGLSLGYRWLGIASNLPASRFIAGKMYTISWEQKVDEINQSAWVGLYHRLQGTTSNNFHNNAISNQETNSETGVWEVKSHTFTLSSTYDNTSDPSIYVYGNRSAGQGTVYVRNVQLEEKKHNTPFVNGTRTGIVRDCSGLQNNGVVELSSSPDWTSESILGINCISKINGSDNFIKINGNTKPTDEASISFWLKINDNSNPSWTSLFGGGRDGSSTQKWGLSIHIRPENKIFAKFYGTSSKVDMDSSTLNTTQWNHVVITHKSNSHNIYINGVKTSNTTDIGALDWSGFTILYLGRAYDNLKSREISIDDFRIYATMLSDQDVLDLYQTKASVSKNGKLYINQIVEKNEQTNLITPGDIGIGNLSGVTMSITAPDSLGRRIIKNTATTSGTFRFFFPLDILTPYANKNLTFSFNYRFLKGNSFDLTDWCDSTITKIKSNGSIIAQGSRSSYDSTFRFMDASIGADTEVEIWNIKLEQANISTYKTSVDKKGVLTTREINELDLSGMKVKEELGAKWVRLFYHNNKSGTVLFGSKNEFLKCNSEDKISHLWAMELFRGVDNKFEFLLQYQSGGTSYNRWKQSSNFTKDPVAGYEAVSCSWTGNYWGGLEYNGGSATWADGSVNHGNWFYAIGSRVIYNGGIPSWNSGIETGWVELWVRCDDMGIFKMIKNGTCKTSELIEV